MTGAYVRKLRSRFRTSREAVKDPHEAAVAALQAATAATRRGNDQVLYLLLIAAKRDPNYGKAIADLAIVCAKAERWEDAINFYHEAMRVDPSPEIAKLSEAELKRVEEMARLASLPDGKRRRLFDTEFMTVLKMNEPAVALGNLNRPLKVDASRRETLALQGVLEARLAHYAESAKALEGAGRIAPVGRRQALAEAAEIARREAIYEEGVRNAEEAWEKKDYEHAGKMFESAWETNRGRGNVGMQAAVSFLMATRCRLRPKRYPASGSSARKKRARKRIGC